MTASDAWHTRDVTHPTMSFTHAATPLLGKRKPQSSHPERHRLLLWLLAPLLVVAATVAGLSHWSCSCDRSDLTVLNGRALLKASQKIAELWKASGEKGDLSGYLAVGSSEDAYVGDGVGSGEVDPWRCEDGGGGWGDCGGAAAVMLAEGSLSARVRAVCAAYAVTALTSMPILSLWPSDRHMPSTRFSHLFSASSPPTNASSSTSSSSSSSRGTRTGGDERVRRQLASGLSRKVLLRPCAASKATTQELLPYDLFLAPHRAAAAAAAEAAAAAGEGASALLRGPSGAGSVAAVVVDACAFERRVDECLGLLEPSPFVASLVLKEDVHTIANSTAFYVDPLGPSGCSGCYIESEFSPPLCAMRRIAMAYLADRSVSFTLAARNPAHVPQVTKYFDPLRSPVVLKATQSRVATCQLEEEVERRDGEGRMARRVMRVVRKLDVPDEVLMRCHQLQASELFSLSLAGGVMAVNSSALEPRFIAAQAAARRSPRFRVHESVCERREIRPFTKQKWSMFTMVEEKLKLFICTVPKVAANSWLMWLRAMLGQPHPEDPLLALDDDRAGWHMLHVHFTEQRAVQLMTRPDFFRFTFVRNPFSRVLSAYNNKLVVTDAPGNKTGPGSREYWNNAFFRLIRPQWEALKGVDDLVSFRDFVKLVGMVFRERRWNMDRHIALQRDVCALGLIKYDFVGRFENLEEDAKHVVNRFGGKHFDIFSLGLNAHQTKSDKKLVETYDKQTYEMVKKIYALDLEVPFNNISYTAPKPLYDRFESNEV
ncbi:hypothetical protein CLOP_g19380 [Closterium sp. NIES-67]|nr:hypothetical protein CLOP_g19380 [Closterium sp. NIES-67]